MIEYVPRWIAMPETPSQATDSTDRRAFVSAVSGPPARNDRMMPVDGTAEEAERLKAHIIEAVTVEPDQFDRAAYDRLWARWEALDATLTAYEASP